MTRELSQMKVGERAYILPWTLVRCEDGDTFLRLHTRISSEKAGASTLLVERYAGGFLTERPPRICSLNSYSRSWIRDRLSEGIIKGACYFSPKEANMRVSEMKVGESGYIVPWQVKPVFCLAGYVSLYIRKDISVDCKSGGTSRMLIERGPYGIKIDRLEYLDEQSSVKFDIQYLRVWGKPEIPQDVEWVVGWIGDERCECGCGALKAHGEIGGGLTEIIVRCWKLYNDYKQSGMASRRFGNIIDDLMRLSRKL